VNDDDRGTAYRRFRDAVNMNARQLERWLDSAQSKAVVQKRSARAESTGHQSGRRIVALLRTKRSELTDADLSQMRRVAGYVARHMAQRPSGDVRESRWRYSLMNWGHDPMTR
jgi:hypothetical protein